MMGQVVLAVGLDIIGILTAQEAIIGILTAQEAFWKRGFSPVYILFF